MKKISLVVALFISLTGCVQKSKSNETTKDVKEDAVQEVYVLTHRNYDVDHELFQLFEKETGIIVKKMDGDAKTYINKIETEGSLSKADVLITVDAGNLVLAQDKSLLHPIESEILTQNIPSHLREKEGHWFALTKRARVLAYHPDRVDTSQLHTYEDLMKEQYKGKIVVRSSNNMYNQSLLASIIANIGDEEAKNWSTKVVENMARDPKGNDRNQVEEVAAGRADIAIVNSYYIGKLLNSENEAEVAAGQAVKLLFPNQNGRGAHINISGAAVLKAGNNHENAIRLIEFLSSKHAQERYAQVNYEYPVHTEVSPSKLLQSWGSFKEDTLNLYELGANNNKAVLIFNETGWK